MPISSALDELRRLLAARLSPARATRSEAVPASIDRIRKLYDELTTLGEDTAKRIGVAANLGTAQPGSTRQPRKEAIAGQIGPVGRDERRYFVPGNGGSEWFQDIEGGPEMVVVPAGSFMMGSPESEPQRYFDEGPQHRVTIAHPFAVGRQAITRGQFGEFLKATGYDAGAGWSVPGFAQDDSHPVVRVSWMDARAYAGWLAGLTGRRYRLPTEAEWEYSARAGTATPFWWGSTITPAQANYDGNYGYAGGIKGEFRRRTVPVGEFAVNPWGLYNIHGNGGEWCEDAWHVGYLGAPSDGTAWLAEGDPARRVLRGGSWNNYPRNLRSAARIGLALSSRYDYIGFRLVRTLDL